MAEKVYRSTYTYKGKPREGRHSIVNVSEDMTDEEAMQHILGSLPDEVADLKITDVTGKETGPAARFVANG